MINYSHFNIIGSSYYANLAKFAIRITEAT